MANLGHGHVYPRDDGVLARCGGPAICDKCSRDAANKTAAEYIPGRKNAFLEVIKEIDATVALFKKAHAEIPYSNPKEAQREHDNLMNVLNLMRHKLEIKAGLTPDLSRVLMTTNKPSIGAGE